MKCISFNCIGLDSHPKNLALKQLFMANMLDVILLQEILSAIMEIEDVLRGMISNWEFFSIYAIGRSRGISIWINYRTMKVLNTWGREGILVA